MSNTTHEVQNPVFDTSSGEGVSKTEENTARDGSQVESLLNGTLTGEADTGLLLSERMGPTTRSMSATRLLIGEPRR